MTNRKRLHLVPVEELEIAAYTEGEAGVRVILGEAPDTGEVPDKSTGGNLHAKAALSMALRADKRGNNRTRGLAAGYFSDNGEMTVDGIAERGAVKDLVILGVKRVGRGENSEAEIAEHGQPAEVFFEDGLPKNIRGVRAEAARLV